MSNYPELQLGTGGAIIEVVIEDQFGNAKDISAATLKNIHLKKPGVPEIILVKPGMFVTNGADGKLKYTTVVEDLDVLGIWELQAELNVDGFIGKTAVQRFKVIRNLAC